MPEYRKTSVYSETQLHNTYLDLLVNRPIPAESDDTVFTINETYSNRPDLLAYDLYGYADLWWVFAQRNPNTLVNPLLDFKTGTLIYLPKLSNLRDTLGF